MIIRKLTSEDYEQAEALGMQIQNYTLEKVL